MGELYNKASDVTPTTVKAYTTMISQEKIGKDFLLGRDETLEKNPNNQVVVYVYTPEDKQEHTYFHSLSIDKQVEDFMGTAELRCKYDSDLMEYWEPIRNYCAIYGSNKGRSNAKILFIGRVRELRQEGYELVITFQDYGWKFKQAVTQSYADDNVVEKDGYTIMKLMFEALKIDSWVISPTAKYRLQQVGYDADGNVTLNKKKIEEMPDLLERLKKSDPNKAINKWTGINKDKEGQLHNIKNINYTLKYEKPTKRMRKIASQGNSNFEAGESIYGTNYGSSGGGANGSSNGADVSASGNPRPPSDLCSFIGNEAVISAMKLIWAYNRGYADDYSSAKSTIESYAANSPQGYSSSAVACLNTLAKYSNRPDGNNAASIIKGAADGQASSASSAASGVIRSVGETAVNIVQQGYNALKGAYNWGIQQVSNIGKSIGKAIFG